MFGQWMSISSMMMDLPCERVEMRVQGSLFCITQTLGAI